MRFFRLIVCVMVLNIIGMGLSVQALPESARLQGFVYIHEIDPTIYISVRYHGNENFVGQPVDGYKKPVIIMTYQAAQALMQVQKEVQKDGYDLVIYDAYRPQRAVDNFVRWSLNILDQRKKRSYYPGIDKKNVFSLGYVSKKSGHSRGSTVDLTLIERGKSLHQVVVSERILADGTRIPFLDDGTLDMGSSFDLFGIASHTTNGLISSEHQQRRDYLKIVMEKHGFKNYHQEWWHFTLRDEPFSAHHDGNYFDFEVA